MGGSKPKLFAALLIGVLSTPYAFGAPAPVLQRVYDAGVTGANLAETTLTTANVTGNGFGLVFTLPVDDNIMAQPLYVPNVAIAGHGTHNVLYVATMSDSLYAFDADTGGAPLWQINLATRVGATPVPIANFTFSGNRNIIGNLGVLSTPVIDPSTNVLYVVACTLEGGTLAYRLHAVSLLDGSEPHGPGVLVSGSYKGSMFDPRYVTQRMSLALSGNNVVFGFGAVELEYSGGYTGWVMAYDKTSLTQTGIFATVPKGNRGGGVWQSGRPPAVDANGNVYAFSGNGYGGGYDGVNNFSETALKLSPGTGGLSLVDWFTPANWSVLDSNDQDLTSSGPMLIPGTGVLAGGGKNGVLYLLNTSNLGKFNPSDSQVVQKLQIAASEIRGGPVYWNRPASNGGPLLYDWGSIDGLKAYAFNGSTFATTPTSQSSATALSPGGFLTLSANGGLDGTGVLWATTAASGDAIGNPPVPGALYAFDATNVSTPIWSSLTNAARDNFGNFAKFVPPMVANGRVYVATWSNKVAVYGLILKSQTISFPAIAAQTVGTPLALAASASSGLAVSFAASPANVCTVSGSTANLIGAGSCSITASQSGNSTYAAATPVTQNFAVVTAGAPFSLTPAVNPLTLQQNAGGTDTVSVVDAAGFSGAVALSVSGAPAGVNPAFVGNLLVVFPPLTTPTGTYPLTITGSSGATKVKTVLNLVIIPGATFSLTPASSSVTVTAGSSGTDAIAIAPVAGFASAVSFAAAGLPAGATAAFSPASSTSGTPLALATSATTPPGSYPIKITGSVGGTNNSAPFAETATVTLVVN